MKHLRTVLFVLAAFFWLVPGNPEIYAAEAVPEEAAAPAEAAPEKPAKTGEDLPIVPDVTGLPLDEAEDRLEEASFLNVTYRAGDGAVIWHAGNWKVSEQSVPAGTALPSVSEISLVVVPIETESGNAAAGKEAAIPAAVTVSYPKHRAFRSAVAAMTNAFASDGILHRYNDMEGDLSAYFMHVSDFGTWTGKDESTWHAENLSLERIYDGRVFILSCDVTLQDGLYVVNGIQDALDETLSLDETLPCFAVSEDLVEKGRDFPKIDELLAEAGYRTQEQLLPVLRLQAPWYEVEDCAAVVLVNALSPAAADPEGKSQREDFLNIRDAKNAGILVTDTGLWTARSDDTWAIHNMVLSSSKGTRTVSFLAQVLYEEGRYLLSEFVIVPEAAEEAEAEPVVLESAYESPFLEVELRQINNPDRIGDRVEWFTDMIESVLAPEYGADFTVDADRSGATVYVTKAGMEAAYAKAGGDESAVPAEDLETFTAQTGDILFRLFRRKVYSGGHLDLMMRPEPDSDSVLVLVQDGVSIYSVLQ